MSIFVSEFQKPSKWTYKRDMYQVSSATRTSGSFEISSSVDKVKAVSLYLQRDKTNDVAQNPYIFDTFKLNAGDSNSSLTTCKLEYGNGIFYPETEFESDSKVRLFTELMNYSWRKNDHNSGTQVNSSNYQNLYPIIYFYLSYQAERATNDPKQLFFRYELNQAAGANFYGHAIVLYEEEMVIDKVGDQLLIV